MKTINSCIKQSFVSFFSAAFLLSVIIVFSSCAKTQTQPAEETQDTAQARQEILQRKTLIAYYSYSGNTKAVAKQIADKISPYSEVSLFEIETEKKYPEDYKALLKEAKKELDSGDLPVLKKMPENFDDYGNIFIGSPNWYGTITPALRSFIDKADFSGKTAIPFFTHGNGGMQNMAKDASSLLKEKNAVVLDAIAFKGNPEGAPDKDLDEWLSKLGFYK